METNHMFRIDLVERCKQQDRKAQLALYKQYCDGMFCVAMRFINNRDDAEDVLQEAFIKAFQKIHQFKGEVTFGAWLKRIVINKCLDFLKARKERAIEIQENTLQIAEDEDWTVDREVSMEEVKQAMLKLPEKYQYVLQLYLLEGFDHEEIGQILGLTNTASRTRLVRGKGFLRAILTKKEHETGS
ncbi:RNA polymerase sigma factor [Muriicola sp.]|uniref:RNA polymerase sigma factor n=1 Tax=Muriicola sp. TaxID=2020856 RepID=UPI003C76D008